MGKSSKAPSAPDPEKTASAQTSTNIGTAVANSWLGNVNQVTPDGTLTYSQSGTKQWTDPVSGKVHDIPITTATQTLSKQQQAIKDQTDAASLNLGTIANQQSNKIGSLLNTTIDPSKLPAWGDLNSIKSPNYQQYSSGPLLQTNAGYAGQIASGYGDAGGVNRSIASGGAINGQIAGAGNVQTGFQSGGSVQNGIASGGAIDRSIDGAGNIATGFGKAGTTTKSIADAGDVTRSFGDAGDITRSYGSDFSQDRTKVEDAMFARLNPQIERDRAALESSLANKGVGMGSTAYTEAMANFDRGVNDQRTQITLAGGQEQSRLANLEAQRAGFENAAQQQAYNQEMGRGSFANSAQAQTFSQNAAQAQFQNATQQQDYSQLRDRAAFANEAQAQKFGQNAAQSQFANAAQAQAFGQNASQAAFGNAAQQQQYDQALGKANFANAGQQQQFNQNAAQAAFGNDAQAQRFSQNAAQAQFGNTAQQQAYEQLKERAAFGNQAQAQQYNQNAQNAGLYNAAMQQMYGNSQAAVQGNNALADQGYNQDVSRYNAQNAARNAALQEQIALRANPINEISALMSGSQVSNPNFVNTNMPTIANTDYAGLVQQNYANQMAQYQQQQQSQNSLLGGLFGLGSSAILASDRRLKTDVRRVGTGPLGLALYAYRYVWGGPSQVGVMAQDVLRVLPEAVVRMANGFLAVDYGKLLARGA